MLVGILTVRSKGRASPVRFLRFVCYPGLAVLLAVGERRAPYLNVRGCCRQAFRVWLVVVRRVCWPHRKPWLGVLLGFAGVGQPSGVARSAAFASCAA